MTLTATERDLVDAASRWFDAHRAQFVDELCELLRYPSVSDESDPNPRPGAPYGPEVRRVFDHMLAKAGRDGLPTRDYTGHVMEVVYPQENVETDRDIAFVDHLDVVPADDGWTHDAFDPQAIGDIVIGRGSLDNKGVALTSYFLLRFFKEHDHRFRHRVRILFGGSEEIALNDIKWFVANIGAPYQAIVTDGPFPVNNIQKGLLDVDVELPVGPQLRGWHAGTATNTVPGAAAITLTGVDESTVRQAFCQSGNIAPDIAERLHINATAQGVTIEATGVAGHACQPSGTVNAIAVLTTALARSGLLEGRDLTAAQAIAQWTKDSYGTGLGIDCENAESGPTTANGGLIIPANEFAEADKVLGAVSGETSEDAIVLHFDIRYAVGRHTNKSSSVFKHKPKRRAAALSTSLTMTHTTCRLTTRVSSCSPQPTTTCSVARLDPWLSATAPTPALSRAHSTSVPNSMPTMCRRSTASTWRPRHSSHQVPATRTVPMNGPR